MTSNTRKAGQGNDGACGMPGMPVSIFVCPDGSVVIADLFEWMIPLVHSLNPSNQRISNIFRMLNQEKQNNESIHHNQDGIQ